VGRIALIDGDIVAYRCAASCEPTKTNPISENERIAIARTDELLDRILGTVKTAEYRIFLSGSENFRKLLYPDYKRNRDDIPKPRHLDTLRDLLVREWGAEVCAGYEADDGIGIAHVPGAVICSIDKDFRQIAGEHYNFVREQSEVITPDEAALAFWSHMLIGDTSDNVRGVAGIGTVKAGRHLQALRPSEMEARVYELYNDRERFLLNRKLLTILRSEEEYVNILEELGATTVSESERPETTAASS
jgi:5'-3' exonuclease